MTCWKAFTGLLNFADFRIVDNCWKVQSRLYINRITRSINCLSEWLEKWWTRDVTVREWLQECLHFSNHSLTIPDLYLEESSWQEILLHAWDYVAKNDSDSVYWHLQQCVHPIPKKIRSAEIITLSPPGCTRPEMAGRYLLCYVSYLMC